MTLYSSLVALLLYQNTLAHTIVVFWYNVLGFVYLFIPQWLFPTISPCIRHWVGTEPKMSSQLSKGCEFVNNYYTKVRTNLRLKGWTVGTTLKLIEFFLGRPRKTSWKSGIPSRVWRSWRSMEPFQGGYKLKTIFLIILRYYLPFLSVQWSLLRGYLMRAITTRWVQSSYKNAAFFHQSRDLQIFKTMSPFSLCFVLEIILTFIKICMLLYGCLFCF